MRMKLVCSAVVLFGLIASPAMATVMVGFDPVHKTVVEGSGPFTMDIVADIPEAEAVVGWGLDLTVIDTLVAQFTGTVTIGPAWFQASGPANKDGDGLAGLAFPTAVFGNDVLLATVTFMPGIQGDTPVVLSDEYPTDLTEGFALDGGGFATVQYDTGLISVIPEPATLVLFALALLRRR